MNVHEFIITLAVILLSARVLAELAGRVRVPPVIGDLMAGILLGPSVFGWIEPEATIRIMAEIGVLLLLFKVGLGTDVIHLAKTSRVSLMVACIGFLVPFAFGFALARFVFDLSLLVSLFIGGTLTATSIGISIRVLDDFKRQHSSEGRVVLGAAVMDDILGVVLLALLYEFALNGGIYLPHIGKVVLFILIFLLMAPVMVKSLSLLIEHYEGESQIPGLLPTAIVSLILFFSWLAYAVGAPPILGAFATGLALSRRFHLPFGGAMGQENPNLSDRIDFQMQPISQLMTPVFFVFVGLSLNLREVDWSSPFIWTFFFLLLVSAVIGKLASGLCVKGAWAQKLAVGLSMVPRGEVGLVFAELGLTAGILSNELYSGMILVIAATTFLPPFIMKWLYQTHGHTLDDPA
ncbi:MAG: cation:proton antiporter [Nitrospinota bacterium]|nr:cation:proton antiporter [Nitrospinota bacterium]